MAAKPKKTGGENPKFGPKDPEAKPFLGLGFLILGLLVALAIWDYDTLQNSRFGDPVQEQNLVGEFGVQVAYWSLTTIGLAAHAIPVIALWMAYFFFRPFNHRLGSRRLLPIGVIILSLCVFGVMLQLDSATNTLEPGKTLRDSLGSEMFPFGWGGVVGFWVYGQILREFLGLVGTAVVFGVLSLFSLAFLLFDNVGRDLKHLYRVKLGQWAESRVARAAERARRRAEKVAAKEARKAALANGKAPAEKAAEAVPSAQRRALKLGLREDEIQPFEPIVESIEEESAPPSTVKDAPPPVVPEKEQPTPVRLPRAANPTRADSKPQNLRIIAGEEVRKAAVKLPEKKGNYKFPPMRLLSEPKGSGSLDDESVHQQTADMLVKTLEEFGVRVTTGDVHTGPVITRYDVYPAAGVRVERIVNLDRNLALNLKAMSVRILAPVPGKGCVGIEVPNKSPQSVFIRDILESEDWVNTKAEIPIALGKEVSGKPLIADLTKMPHLLIAGSTGSGKTVCINSVITSLLYHSSPEDLRFVMVDPKIVEMQVYNALPHMLVPVVTDPKKVPNALKYLLNEMEKRYQLFASVGVRNIAGYNAKMAKSRQEAAEAEERAAAIDAELTPEERAAAASIEVPRDPGALGEPPTKLPYIVCIVDELADLMMVAPADIETGIARLAQLARAAGIHLILATQRPSVNVITGVIKANLPSRIAFKVASKIDSRTILDTGGADQLIGKGDMLFLPPGSADLVRAQGAFVADDEITGIVNHIRDTNGEPEFDEQFQRNIETSEEGGDGGAEGDWDDDLVPDAIEVIRTSKRASTSMLQRRLKIGYNRAARIMEILEAQGMVGPENGSSPREILMDLDS